MKGQERLDCESPLLFLLLFLQIIGFSFFCPSSFCQPVFPFRNVLNVTWRR